MDDSRLRGMRGRIEAARKYPPNLRSEVSLDLEELLGAYEDQADQLAGSRASVAFLSRELYGVATEACQFSSAWPVLEVWVRPE